VRRAIVVTGLLLAACRNVPGDVQPLSVSLSVAPTALDLGSVYVQATASGTLHVVSTGTAAETVTVTLPQGPFSTPAGPTFAVEPGADVAIPVVFAPTAAGSASATAHVAWDEGSADVALSGQGLAWPACAPEAQCQAAAFDPDAGVCVRTPLGDGAACDAGLDCLQDAQCLGGQCLGAPRDCNDDNACTLDACVPGQGCVHQDESGQCTGTDPCQIYYCDPTHGCASETAPNGTPCSNDESCQTAKICVLGQCIGTPVPDGFPCKLWWEPCVNDAECHGGKCDSPTADAEQPGQLRWSWPPVLDAGAQIPRYTSIAVAAADELGNSYLTASPGSYADPEVASLASLDSCGNLRWQNASWLGVQQLLLDGQELVFLDPASNHLVALFRDTGQVLWNVDLLPALIGGGDGGSALPAVVTLSDLALSPKGPIYVSGVLTYDVGADLQPQPFLAAVLADGTVAWAKLLPPENVTSFGSPLVADLDGNAYVYADVECDAICLFAPDAGGPGPALWSYDPAGNSRFALPLGTTEPVLAVGTDRIVEVSTASIWALDGGSLESVRPTPFSGPPSAVLDGAGDMFIAGIAGDFAPTGAVAAFDGTTPLWTTPIANAGPFLFPALGQGQLFVATWSYCEVCDQPSNIGQSKLLALSTADGGQLWSVTLSPVLYGLEPPGSALTLTNTADLLFDTIGGTVDAYFAGQQRPPPDAPWSRWRGSYANQASSAPPPQPSGL